MFRILIVCTGNLCRSPMAEGILRSLLEVHGLSDRVEVRSAGTWTADGDPASENAVEAASRRGVSIARHRSARLTGALARDADLILTMEPAHLEEVLHLDPDAEDRAEVLTLFAEPEDGDPAGVDDPYGSDLSRYLATYDELDHLLRVALPRILSRIQVGGERDGRRAEG